MINVFHIGNSTFLLFTQSSHICNIMVKWLQLMCVVVFFVELRDAAIINKNYPTTYYQVSEDNHAVIFHNSFRADSIVQCVSNCNKVKLWRLMAFDKQRQQCACQCQEDDISKYHDPGQALEVQEIKMTTGRIQDRLWKCRKLK